MEGLPVGSEEMAILGEIEKEIVGPRGSWTDEGKEPRGGGRKSRAGDVSSEANVLRAAHTWSGTRSSKSELHAETNLWVSDRERFRKGRSALEESCWLYRL